MKMEKINKYSISEKFDSIENIKLFYIFKDNSYESNVFIVTNDDKIHAYGGNSTGVLGFGYQKSVSQLTINDELSHKKIIDFNNGNQHVIARTYDGKVFCWGKNEYGALGNNKQDSLISKPVLNEYLSDKCIVDICCGFGHTLVLTISGDVYAWGFNSEGPIGNGKNNHVLVPYHVEGFCDEKVKAIACGLCHSMALTEGGNVYTWGLNRYGQLGHKRLKNDLIHVPKLIEIEEKFQKISCGKEHSLLLSCNGDIYVFGRNESGQLGNKEINVQIEIPFKLKNENKFIDVASHAHNSISMALSINQKIFIWGKCGDKIVKTPLETQFVDFEEIFVKYFQITFKTISIEKSLEENTGYNLISNGKYEQEFLQHTKIDQGSYGEVFKATQKSTQEVFAIKKIIVKDENESLREIANILLIDDLKSPMIVKFYDVWLENELISKNSEGETTLNSIVYVQMELCDKTLEKVISEIQNYKELKLNSFLSFLGFYITSKIFIQILEGIDFLHKKGIIHRDLKPDNILLKNENNGRFVKISDLGLAKVLQNEYNTKDVGNTKYMAPEVMTRKNYDMKADIYSLGLIMKHMFNIEFSM